MRFQRLLRFAVSLSSFTLVAGPLHGQSQPAATQQPAATTPAPAQTQTTTQPNTKQTKVWTNDDVDSLRNDRGVSVVGKDATQNAGAKTAARSYDKDPAWYRQQLEPLEAEIARLDAQIEKTKAFLKGEKVNDQAASVHAYYGVPGDPQEQLKKLEDRRAKDAEKVNDLLDRARHNDIAPGDLR